MRLLHSLNYLKKYSGVITVLILWVSILTAISKANLSIWGTAPLSSLGVTEASAVYFSTGLMLAAFSFMIFGTYLKNYFVISRGFLTAMFIGQLSQIIAALAPYGDKQPMKLIHTLAAFTLAFSIPIMLFFFAVAQKTGPLWRAAILLMWAEIAAFILGIGAFAFVFKGAPFGQILPAVAFHAWIIFISIKIIRMKEGNIKI